jgi:hypothetical protein
MILLPELSFEARELSLFYCRSCQSNRMVLMLFDGTDWISTALMSEVLLTEWTCDLICLVRIID